MDGTDPLSQLKDIHLPEPIGFWPPAPGWWLLFFLLCLAIYFGGKALYAAWRKRRACSFALRELDKSMASFKDNAKGADADAVMANAQEVSVSSGSACTSRVPAPSHVLVSMGMTHEDSAECLRFSVGRPTTREEIGTAVAALSAAIERVRNLTR